MKKNCIHNVRWIDEHLEAPYIIIKTYLKKLAKLKTENSVKEPKHPAFKGISQRDKKKYSQLLAQYLAQPLGTKINEE